MPLHNNLVLFHYSGPSFPPLIIAYPSLPPHLKPFPSTPLPLTESLLNLPPLQGEGWGGDGLPLPDRQMGQRLILHITLLLYLFLDDLDLFFC